MGGAGFSLGVKGVQIVFIEQVPFLFIPLILLEMSEEGYNNDNKYLVCLIARSGTGRALRQLKFLKLSTQTNRFKKPILLGFLTGSIVDDRTFWC